jgi:hypothetical protein
MERNGADQHHNRRQVKDGDQGTAERKKDLHVWMIAGGRAWRQHPRLAAAQGVG